MNQNKALTFNDLKFLFALIAAVVTIVLYMDKRFDSLDASVAVFQNNELLNAQQHQVLFKDIGELQSTQTNDAVAIAGLEAQLNTKK